MGFESIAGSSVDFEKPVLWGWMEILKRRVQTLNHVTPSMG